MATIGKVSAVFTASTSGLTSGVKDASNSLAKLEGDVGSLRKGIGVLVALDVGRFFMQMVSGAIDVGKQLVSMGAAEAEVIDRTSKLADRLGMTYGELSGLAMAGDLAGVSLDQIATASTKADVALVRAAGGSKTAQAGFDSIGLSVKDLQSLSPAERFNAIASAIAALPTPAARAEAAVRLFGRAGAELLPLFNSGAGAIQEAAEDARRFGLALTNVQGKNVEAMNDAFTRAQSAIKGVIQQVVAYLAPAIKNVADTFTKLIGDVGGTTIGQTIGRGILEGAQFLAKIGDMIVANLSKVWAYVSQVGGQWNAIVEAAKRVFAFFAGVVNVMEIAFGSIIAGFTVVAEALLSGGAAIANAVGLEWPALDTALESLHAFNQELGAGLEGKTKEAADNFNYAIFGDTNQIESAGAAIAGPFESMILNSIDLAEDSINAVDEITSRPFEVEEHVDVEVAIKDAVKGVDSRSREGVAEMFRMLRETLVTKQEETNDHLRKIADNTAMGEEPEVFELAPAAGV